MEAATWILAFETVVLVIATVFLACTTRRYTKATRDMASVAEKTLRLNSLRNGTYRIFGQPYSPFPGSARKKSPTLPGNIMAPRSPGWSQTNKARLRRIHLLKLPSVKTARPIHIGYTLMCIGLISALLHCRHNYFDSVRLATCFRRS